MRADVVVSEDSTAVMVHLPRHAGFGYVAVVLLLVLSVFAALRAIFAAEFSLSACAIAVLLVAAASLLFSMSRADRRPAEFHMRMSATSFSWERRSASGRQIVVGEFDPRRVTSYKEFGDYPVSSLIEIDGTQRFSETFYIESYQSAYRDAIRRYFPPDVIRLAIFR